MAVDLALQKKRVEKSRVKLFLNQPFFAILLFNLEEIWTEAVPTMGTDGKRLLINPNYCAGLSDEEIKGVLAHEVLHCAFSHMTRRNERDPRAWNIACDLAINPVVTDSGLKLPAGVLFDPQHPKDSAEEHYSRLPVQKQNGQQGNQQGQGQPGQKGKGQGQGQGQGQGNQQGNGQPGQQGKGLDTSQWQDIGGVLDAPAGSNRDELTQKWTLEAEKAAVAAKRAGKLPGSLERLVGELKAPKVDWKAVLRRYVEGATQRSDVNWCRPNRRFSDIYLPDMDREGCGTVVIGIDTSGSIGEPELAQFGGEVNAILSDVKPEKVHVVYCDTRVAHVDEYGPGEEVILKPHGGGGTDFRPVFDWVTQQGIQPQCVIYFTDLYGSFPAHEPPYPTVWAATTDLDVPWGERVKVEFD